MRKPFQVFFGAARRFVYKPARRHLSLPLQQATVVVDGWLIKQGNRMPASFLVDTFVPLELSPYLAMRDKAVCVTGVEPVTVRSFPDALPTELLQLMLF